jgi:hypothetical protein
MLPKENIVMLGNQHDAGQEVPQRAFLWRDSTNNLLLINLCLCWEQPGFHTPEDPQKIVPVEHLLVIPCMKAYLA